MSEERSAAVALERAVEVKLGGKPYKMRRLTTRDVFTYCKLIARAMKVVGREDVTSPEGFGLIMLAGMAEADAELLGFYSSIVGMAPEEFGNQPPEFLADFLEELPKHIDLAVFSKAVALAIQAQGSLWQQLPGSSSGGTGGQTSTS